MYVSFILINSFVCFFDKQYINTQQYNVDNWILLAHSYCKQSF